MSGVRAGVLLRQVRRFLQGQRGGESADGELLERFRRQDDDTAFAALVERHGAHVWGVCRRLLRHHQDAEDVFQATFLVLARKASAVRNGAAVGSFLHGVAHRLALRARADAARRRLHESRVPRPAPADPADLSWGDVRGVLDEELARLPEVLRAPLVLCYYEGQTQDEAARQLGWKKRTVKARLERGRRLLRGRLARRGLDLGAALAAPLLASEAPAAALVDSTVRAALPFKGGSTAGLSASVAALARGGLQAMFLGKLQAAAVGLLAVVLLGTAGVLLTQAPRAAAPADPPPKAAKQGPVDRAGDLLPAGAVIRLGTVRFRHDGNGLTGLAFLPDGKTLISAADRDSVRFWDAATGRTLREIRTEPLSIRSFALSPDGKRFAVGGFLPNEGNRPTAGAVRVYDTAGGKMIRTFSRSGDDTDHCALAFTPDGKLLLSLGARSGKLRVEEIASGVELLRHSFPSDVVNYLALSRDGETLAVASGPNTRKLFVWRWQSGEEPRQLTVGERVGRDLSFSPDGKRLAECSDTDSTIRLWDVARGKLLHKLEPPREESASYLYMVFTPDGKGLAASGYRRSWDGLIDLWDPASGRFLRRIDAAGGPTARLALSPEGGRIAAAGDHTIRVWDLASGKELADDDEAHRGYVGHIVAAGSVAATASDDHTVRVWDVATGRQRLRLTHDNWVRGIALSPDGKLLVSSSLDDTVRLWDLSNGREIYRLPGHGAHGGRRVVGLTADGRRFLSWGEDYYLRVWDVKTGKALKEHRTRPTGVKVPDDDEDAAERDMRFLRAGEGAFSADGKMFVLGIGARTFVFDVDTGKEVRVLDTEQRSADAMAVSGDARLLLTGSWGKAIQTRLTDGRMRLSAAEEHPLELWDLAAGKRLQSISLPGATSGPVAFSADGKTMATTVEKPEGRIRLWDVASGEERPSIGGLPGRATALAFTPDGRYLLAAMSDTSALVWKLKP
jgi:RNA polymerase sigma factor (sigma-70 family)